jgi:hypothetical protein
VIKIMLVQTQIWRELRVMLHKPSLKKKEIRGVRDGLTKPKVQPILSGAICSFLLHDGSFGFVQRLVRDLECVHAMLKGSPPH